MFRNELIIYSTSIFSTVRGGFGIGADGELFHFHLDDAAIDCIEHGGFRCDFVCELSMSMIHALSTRRSIFARLVLDLA